MSPVPGSPSAIAWLPWSSEAFARARAERKPVLLSISAAWCRTCRDMDRTSYADAAIAAVINDRFIPIRVDADERPDISERYNLGGWPTTAFLTPEGAILGGGTYVSSGRMPEVLAQVAAAFAIRDGAGETDDTREVEVPLSAAVPQLDDLSNRVFASFDADHGGFGTEPKFPLVAPVQLAMDLWLETHDPRFETIVVTTLDAMGWGGLYDEVDGGFFRYAATRDWQSPHSEKLLEVNASLLRLYLDAGIALGITRFTERATDVLRYIQTWLADPVDGGWSGSQQADEVYYAAASAERRAMAPPAVAHVLYTDWNAAMVSAALHTAKVFDDEGLTAFAIKSIERVLLPCYKPGAGVAHYIDCSAGLEASRDRSAGLQASPRDEPRVRGLLTDQMAMASASLDAFDVTDNIVYEMMAEELAHYAVRVLWDDVRGGFFDCADGGDVAIGLMGRRLKPFAANCDAARTLRRLAKTSGDSEFSRLADATLTAMAPFAAEHGPLAAHYVLAVRDGAQR